MPNTNGSAGLIDIAEARKRLEPFLTDHSPQTEVKEVDFRGAKAVVISKPWGDESLQLHLSGDPTELIDALNAVKLPARYSAIWHKDSKSFEVVWLAYPIPQDYKDLSTRSFVFRYRGKDYECAYGPSSKRLMVIAESFETAGAVNTTFYRLLGSFRIHARAEKGVPGFAPIPDGKPVCFWIKGIDEWNDDAILELVTNLNFFMQYHDTHTPQVNIHLPLIDSVMQSPVRFPTDSFPATIVAKPIPDTLLQFWAGSLQGDAARRFLYNYLIIEYAAAFFLETEKRQAILKCISAPNAVDNIANVTREVIAELNDSKFKRDADKVDALLREVLKPLRIWRELKNNEGFFTTSTRFEGGVVVEPLLRANGSVEDFTNNKGIQRFSVALRAIRNGLSHGRGEKQSDVITPTTTNFRLLQSWIGPISLAAREVIVYRDVV